MLDMRIDFNVANKNINYINRIKRDLSSYVSNTSSLSFINRLEALIDNELTIDSVNRKLGLKLSEEEYKSIFLVRAEDCYPTELQKQRFIYNINKEVSLTEEESSRLGEKFVHSWQVPRTTELPTLNILLNLIKLYSEDDIDNILLSKMSVLTKKHKKVA